MILELDRCAGIALRRDSPSPAGRMPPGALPVDLAVVLIVANELNPIVHQKSIAAQRLQIKCGRDIGPHLGCTRERRQQKGGHRLIFGLDNMFIYVFSVIEIII